MKEIMAIVRQNKVNATKDALADAGFPAFTCRKIMGRGKNPIDIALIETIMSNDAMPVTHMGEHMTEASRLIPKRCFMLAVPDEEVERLVNVIMEVNSTGNRGDGKIFVLPITESYRVRDGESTCDMDASY